MGVFSTHFVPLIPILAQTAKKSPEIHFRFINYFIQPSRVGSLCPIHVVSFMQISDLITDLMSNFGIASM
jgi:hypothetical protein